MFIYSIKLPRFNFLIVIFILSILTNYTFIPFIDYLFLIVLFLSLVETIILTNREYYFVSINKLSYSMGIIFLILLFITSMISGFEKFKLFLSFYFPIFLTMLLVYVKVRKYGNMYIEKFIKQFSALMNVFSVMNLVQYTIKRPILQDFLIEKYANFQNWALGTDQFRTISVFGHPIVAGLFFVITFICNSFLPKSVWKYIFQFIVLINIYSTGSRSSWLAITLVIFIFITKKIFFNKGIKLNIKLNWKTVFRLYLIVCFAIFALGILFGNISVVLDTIINRFGDSLSSTSTDISNLQRVGTIELIFSNFTNDTLIHQLFGNGIGTISSFMLNHTVEIPGFITTDNQYLTWLFEFGLLGILLLTIWIVVLLSNFIKIPSKINLIAGYSLITILFLSLFFESISSWKPITFTFGVFIGILSLREIKIKHS